MQGMKAHEICLGCDYIKVCIQKGNREYLVDLNATQAAIRAKYSQKTAYSIGFDLLKKPEVQKEIARLRDKELAKSGAKTKSECGR